MTKFHSIYDVTPSCKLLNEAYERALGKAFDLAPRPGAEICWDGTRYGNAVSTKGTLIGADRCLGCNKRIEVILSLEPVAATNLDREAVKLYDTIGGKETIKLSGHRCKEAVE